MENREPWKVAARSRTKRSSAILVTASSFSFLSTLQKQPFFSKLSWSVTCTTDFANQALAQSSSDKKNYFMKIVLFTLAEQGRQSKSNTSEQQKISLVFHMIFPRVLLKLLVFLLLLNASHLYLNNKKINGEWLSQDKPSILQQFIGLPSIHQRYSSPQPRTEAYHIHAVGGSSGTNSSSELLYQHRGVAFCGFLLQTSILPENFLELKNQPFLQCLQQLPAGSRVLRFGAFPTWFSSLTHLVMSIFSMRQTLKFL